MELTLDGNHIFLKCNTCINIKWEKEILPKMITELILDGEKYVSEKMIDDLMEGKRCNSKKNGSRNNIRWKKRIL